MQTWVADDITITKKRKKEQEPATHDPDVQIMVEQPESNIPPETIRYINEIVQEMYQQE